MSSARTGEKEQDQWRTPAWLFERCALEFGGYTCDAAASAENTFCPDFYSEENSGLVPGVRWGTRTWCNPPYSMLRQFAEEGINQVRSGYIEYATFLIPARTDTRAFQAMAKVASDIVFLAGRVKFESPGVLPGKGNSAPFPSAVVQLSKTSNVVRVRFEDWRP